MVAGYTSLGKERRAKPPPHILCNNAILDSMIWSIQHLAQCFIPRPPQCSELVVLVVLLLCSSTRAFEILVLGVLVLVLQFQHGTTRVRPVRRFLSWMAVSAGPVALSEVATLPVQVPLL